ncbi:MAG: sulfite reductase [Alphaproteobacteria bacterium 13_2_20CM_2_64_7]|nr:MAG: sulfite reductase [Alphaproteobacteria bacterium 13_2_20CM_2_64_7]
MILPPQDPLPSLIPESAPFSAEQRVWLNGLFAGLLSLEGGITALSSEQAAALVPGALELAAPAAPAAKDDDGAPWHDPAMALADRMKLAEGRPLRRRMMAAMGQQDCGQCGYNCQDYSDAIFLQKEKRLNLCVPGGKETARMLKALHEEVGKSPAAAEPKIPTPADATAAPAAVPEGSRECPVEAVFASRTRLNKPGSEKETWHIEFDLTGSGLEYAVGDAFGIFPSNDPALVDATIAALDAPPDFPIGGRTLRDVLIDGVSLGAAPDMLFQLFSYITGGERRQKAKALAAGEDPDGDAATLDVLAAIKKFPGVRPDPEAFVEALDPLQPRLYSIACSPRIDQNRMALCVDAVRYPLNSRTRLGVASTFLGERLRPGDKVKAYVQKAQHFGLPADPAAPIIMIGPGTGIAPFRAFLYERMASKAPGRSWLFFGHQRRDHDFFYEDELNGMKAAGALSRLSLAWSRDGSEKFYVQDRMRQLGRELWAWLADGAHIYVCGDAKRMAKDVERAWVEIVAAHGARTTDEAIAFVANLKKSGRYQQDVY